MVYDYVCEQCGHTFEVIGVLMANRNEPQPCPIEGCDGEGHYDFGATARTNRVVVHEDVNSFVERRGGRSPQAHGGCVGRGKGSTGAGRHYPGDPRHEKNWV